ncbi:unnamed protein product [Cylicocyclus nassatus]|uniref:Uncharacterized protein n=1 Tax=Cylicocyclus nassatus TaxID=53992 RepID=A0AA36HF48_CYLNA|nr:unnamed protein product [Cylicocyclus nassatus]
MCSYPELDQFPRLWSALQCGFPVSQRSILLRSTHRSYPFRSDSSQPATRFRRLCHSANRAKLLAFTSSTCNRR